MSCLQTHNLTIGYASKVLLSKLNLSLKKGEMVCLVGPNGTGKSTLIKTLTNIINPISGSVLLTADKSSKNIKEIPLKDLAQHISIVLTDKLPPTNFSVYDIVSLGRVPHTNWLGNLSKNDDKIINEALEKVNLTTYKDRKIDSLSDGEKQRVMFAKALAQDTEIIILDEPTAHLDVVYRAELLSLLKNLAETTQKAILISTHELEMAIQSADHIWLIDNNKQLIAQAPEDLVLSNAFSETFKGNQIYFDENNGSFRIKNTPKYKINLTGTGLRTSWTKHALEKRNFETVAEDCSLKVNVTESKWELNNNGVTTNLDSITALLSKLATLQNV